MWIVTCFVAKGPKFCFESRRDKMCTELIHSLRNKHLLCVKHCSRQWGCSCKWKGLSFSFKSLYDCRYAVSDQWTPASKTVWFWTPVRKTFKWKLRFLPLEMESHQASRVIMAGLFERWCWSQELEVARTKDEYQRDESSRQLDLQMQKESMPVVL